MQTNPNIPKKQVIEVWNWRDFPGDYSPWFKKYYRRLRRKIEKREFKKLLRGENYEHIYRNAKI